MPGQGLVCHHLVKLYTCASHYIAQFVIHTGALAPGRPVLL